jgi:hypothetical protein
MLPKDIKDEHAQFTHWLVILSELAKKGIVDMGDSEAGRKLLRGLTESYRQATAKLLYELLQDPKTNSKMFRDLLIDAVTTTIRAAYLGSHLSRDEVTERFATVYPLMAQNVAYVVEKWKPIGWKEVLEELPMQSFSKPAHVQISLSDEDIPPKTIEETGLLYS